MTDFHCENYMEEGFFVGEDKKVIDWKSIKHRG